MGVKRHNCKGSTKGVGALPHNSVECAYFHVKCHRAQTGRGANEPVRKPKCRPSAWGHSISPPSTGASSFRLWAATVVLAGGLPIASAILCTPDDYFLCCG